jgi:hypothetical protein
MTVIEIRPHRWGWKAFEAGEIRVLNSTGNVERAIAFNGGIGNCDSNGKK